jgi:diguanylate cyclase (GGDEF)-like protein
MVVQDASRISAEKRLEVPGQPANLFTVTELPSAEKKSGMHRRLAAWEATAHRLLHRLHLDRIRLKILVFALVATLVPTVTMSYHSYSMNREHVNAKISEELRNASTQSAREFNLWLKERFYETRVFSSSYEVTENVEQLGHSRDPGRRSPEATRRLTDYLASVRSKFPDYDGLSVLDLDGDRLVPRDGEALNDRLPRDWVRQIQADANVIGEAYRDANSDKPAMLIAVPIKSASGRLLGAMAGRLNFDSIERLLKVFVVGQTGRLHLVDRDGRLIISSAPPPVTPLAMRLPAAATASLTANGEAIASYADYLGEAVIGTMRPVSALGWTVVAEISRGEAYGRVSRQRNISLLMLGGLVVAVGFAAYVLALTVVRPLERLTAGAKQVGAGDFKIDVPVLDYGEVGYLTRTFNTMVTSLREGREELAAINVALETLSVTDGLTGLFNHKHLMETLGSEVARAERHKHPLSILMIDVDHFKQYNDRFGHQTGDKLLADIAALFKQTTRSIDYAARYGGDEFLLLLHEVGADDAMELANRVRSSVAAAAFGASDYKVTVSIGVASYPEHGETAEAVIAAADAGLYKAKRGGRNETVLATGDGARDQR